MEGTLWKKSDRFSSWNRRWCVVANGCLYYFYSRRDRSPRGVVPLEDLTVRPLNRRGKFRFEITAAMEDASCDPNDAHQLTSHSIFALSVDGKQSLGGTVRSTQSVRSLLTPSAQLFSPKQTLPLIKSAKYVKGQLVEGKRDRYVFQCATEVERDRWVKVLIGRVQRRPVAVSFISDDMEDKGERVQLANDSSGFPSITIIDEN